MLKVGFNPALNFKANQPNENLKARVVLPQDSEVDSYETPKNKKTTRDGVANVWKFFSVTKTMSGAIFKGIAYGALATLGVVAAFWPFKALPKAFARENAVTIGKLVSNPFKHIGKAGKILSVAAGLATFGYQWIKGRLDANENTATIDHKLKVGHRDV